MAYRLPSYLIRAQIRYDLIGKDSQRGITLSYGWLANQCGHCMLGYVPTHLFYLLFHYGFKWPSAELIATAFICFVWLAFEIYNVWKSIHTEKKTGSTFRPDWPNIIHDTLTDLAFFATGALLAGIVLGGGWILLMALGMVFLFQLVACRKWYHTKIFQQAAEFPIQFRLSQFNRPLHASNVDTIIRFNQLRTGGHHLLITGTYKSGKTSLAVALGNELAIREGRAKYTTAMKLFGLSTERTPEEHSVPTQLWHWREADLLIIDDINCGTNNATEIISPQLFDQYIQQGSFSEENLKSLRNNNVIWVIGVPQHINIEHLITRWQYMLTNLGIEPQNILHVNLLATDTLDD